MRASAERMELERKVSELRTRLADRASQVERLRAALVEACDRLASISDAVEDNGCDCDCDHGADEHDEDCERCLACCVCAGLGARNDIARLRRLAEGES